MSERRRWHCDGPDCNVNQATESDLIGARHWLEVSWWGTPTGTYHFCSWDCCLKFAAAQEPIEVIDGTFGFER